MSSVNLIQFSEPRPQPSQGNPARAGDPFGDLLASTSASRPEPEARQRPNEPRQEPVAPRTRGDARRDTLQRSHDDGDCVRAAETDRRVEADAAEPRAADSDAPQSDQAADSESGKDSRQQSSEASAQTGGDAAQVEEAPAADGEVETATVEPEAEAGADSNAADAARITGETDSDGEAVAEDSSSTDDADVLVTEVAPGTDTPPVVETADTETDELPVPVPVVEETPEADAGDELPIAAGEADDATIDEAAAQAAATPARATQGADTDSPAPTPVQPAVTRSAGAGGEQSQTQPTAQGGVAPQAAADDAAMQFGDGNNEQAGQKQPEAPLTQAKAPEAKPQDAKPQDAKPQEIKPAAPAEAAKPATPGIEAATKAQPDTLPEPVRALAATLNPASVNSITFRSVALNERAPVPLTGTALAAEIVSRMRDGMQRFDIRLDPPELGRVDVRLEVDRTGNVKTHLTVDRPETLDLMQREARGLERALQQAGLKTDSGGLEFSLRSHAENGHPDGRPERQDRDGNPFGDDGLDRADTAIDGYRTAAFARGGVDIRI